jgi:hypothetical protein
MASVHTLPALLRTPASALESLAACPQLLRRCTSVNIDIFVLTDVKTDKPNNKFNISLV